MSKGKFNWRKLTALGAVIALTLIQSVSLSRATTNSPRPNTASTDVKLDAELRALDSFLDDWVKLHKQQGALSKKNSLTNAEFNAFKSNAEGVKNRCSQFEGAIRDIIRKLKAAGRWDGLDDEVLAKSNDEKLKSDLREGGGLRHLLEDAASQYCTQARDEITGPVEGLRPKLKAQVQDSFFEREAQVRMVRVSYDPTAPMFTKTLRCIGATIRVAVHLVATGTSGPAGGAHGNRECFCFDNCGAASAT